jgi:hypothetical protein
MQACGVIRALLLCSNLAAVSACAAAPDVNPTLCQLAEQPQIYRHRTVAVEGILLASRHGTSVRDPGCGRGIALTWDSDDPSSWAVNAATRNSSNQTMVQIRATGQLERHRFEGQRTWILALTNIKVTRSQTISDVDAHRYLVWLEGPSQGPFRPSR